MAEHDENMFEQNIAKMLREMDSEIEIPEIPDVESIFEKAEEQKQNVVPFKKYSKYIAAAAAVVLICISFPAFSGTFGRSLPQEAAESFDQSMEYLSDGICEEAEMPMEPEAAAEPETDEEEYFVTVTEALARYFTDNSANVEINFSDSKVSSSVAQEEKSQMEDAKILEEDLDKKRSIELTIGKESVSVILKDISEEEKIISEFWIEGKFEGAYPEGEYYIVNLVKTVTLEDYAEGNYLPMMGEGTEEPFTIPEESIYVPGEVTEGIINLVVEINVETGEYKIYASLI
ncbi:MAG: hypothetical protein IJZ58_07745 [Oscillospiraceae bacterium]|nr:hypothetical protein [Oscillospiraceae bacterium]